MNLEWIINGLEKPGKNRVGLAKALKRNPSAVTQLLAGKRQLKAREIQTIARYLEVDAPKNLALDYEHQIATAFIVGDVAAGVWSEPDVHFDPVPTTVAIDSRWPEDTVYLLRVRGTSINRHAKEGDLVLCLDAFAAPRDFHHGDWVVAERKDADGRIETTVKRVIWDKEAFLLTPDSDDPAHQTPIKLGEHNGQTVSVKAFVLEFIKPATTF